MIASFRSLVGSLALLFGLIIYIVAAVAIGSRLPHVMLIELPYYVVAGILWIFPARAIITWMHQTPKKS